MASRIRVKLVSFLMAASITAGLCAGCSKEAPQSSGSSGMPGTSAQGTATDGSADGSRGDLPVSGTVAGIEYTVYNEGHTNGKEQGGYFIETSGQPDGAYYIIINAGERTSGGYEIRIVDIYEDTNGQFVVVVDETRPDPGSAVTAVMTYPYCGLKVSRVPDKLKVVYTNGNEITRVDDKQVEVTVDAGYFAVLEDGAGEIMHKTYVYKTDSGYRFINVTATTVSWGATEWKEVVNSSGEVSSRDEIVSIAKSNGSCGFVLFAGENKACSIDEFLKRDI